MGIDNQLNYVKNNKTALMDKYDGQYVVISDQLEEIPFKSLGEAYMYGVRTMGLGNFLLQHFSRQNNQVQIINQTITIV